MSGNVTSAANRPRPVTSGTSSRRATGAPTTGDSCGSSCAIVPHQLRYSLLRRRMGLRLDIHVDELHGRLGLVQHAPALHPVIRALQLVGRDRRRIDHDDTPLADILGLERADLSVL